MFGQPTGNSGLSNNERNLRRDLAQVVARNGMFAGQNGPVLIGFTENQIYETSVNGKETAQDNLHLVTQPVNLQLSAGEGETLSVELNNPGLSVIEGNVHHNGLPNGELMFDSTKGTYMLNYELPANFEKQSLRVDSLNLNIRKPTQGVTFAIYNKRVDAYDTIEADSYDQDVQETYVENGVIKIRVTVTDSKQNGPIFVPRVAVEGVTKP